MPQRHCWPDDVALTTIGEPHVWTNGGEVGVRLGVNLCQWGGPPTLDEVAHCT